MATDKGSFIFIYFQMGGTFTLGKIYSWALTVIPKAKDVVVALIVDC